MSISKKIKDAVKEVGLMNELCQHLQQIGINARLLESGSPDAVGPRWKKGIFASSYVLGCVKVEGRNLDLVQVERQPSQMTPPPYGYNYVVRLIVEGLEGKLWAGTKPIGPVDFQWQGGYLAQLLNADSDLQDMLLRAGLNKLLISPDKRNQCVRITPLTVERKAFPTREAFEAYDRIAQHIRSIAHTRP
jgi:hypothetical protein